MKIHTEFWTNHRAPVINLWFSYSCTTQLCNQKTGSVIGLTDAAVCFVRQAVCWGWWWWWCCVCVVCVCVCRETAPPPHLFFSSLTLFITPQGVPSSPTISGLRNPCRANSSCVLPTAATAGNDEMIIYISLLANKGKEVQFSPVL